LATALKTILEDEVDNLSTSTTYLEGRKEFQNLVSDKQTSWPVAFLDLPLKSINSISDSGRITEAWPITMAFLTLGKLDDTPAAKITDSAAMRTLAYELVRALLDRTESTTSVKVFDPESFDNFEVQDLDGVFDASLNGVLLSIELKPLRAGSIC
jgi:hypothetical protein